MTACTSLTKAGKPCRASAMHGRDVCKAHSGDPDAGVHTKLTEPVRNTIVLALASGCYRETAAEHAGIGVSTLYRWLETGEADWEEGKTTPHRELWEAIKKAEADAEVGAVALIRKAAPDSWQAAAWLLERKHPGRWGRHDRVDHDLRIAKPRTSEPVDDSERRETLAIMAASGALDPRDDEEPS